MIRQWIVATTALFVFSGCLVTETTLPAEIEDQSEIHFTVSLESIIGYGDKMNGAPTLCISAPENWKFEALNYTGFSMNGVKKGQPRSVQARGMTFELPAGYTFFCWQGPEDSYDLSSHGKLRLKLWPSGVGSGQLTFIGGYDSNFNYFEYPQDFNVISHRDGSFQ